ncbi:polysaccharide deacetylase family protein [Indiicoccus explosivorum]|uniref:polysaccharide deacetylase family protein n=1 Tax=Indiicoccus explosivorum TaxID=1917864 RepID=UPI001F4E4B94|nr:polysaccharide deacetylase family protein [Indiicoccus explosivorum]
MRYTKWMITLTSVSMLAACGGEETEEVIEENETIEEEVEQSEEELAEETESLEGEPPETATDEEVDEEPAETDEEEVAEETVLEPEYRVNPDTWTLLPLTEEAPEDVVLLTIDDAPDEYAVQMAETLEEMDVPAIFFVNGHLIDSPEGKEKLTRIADMGFAIGNHTWAHENLTELSPEDQTEEIVIVNEQVQTVIGEKPRFFRAPFGENTETSMLVADRQEMVPMNWTYGYDWNEEYMEPEALADIMVNTDLLVDGSILLMHDREWSAAALPEIIQGIRDKGYTFADPALIEGGGAVADIE